MAQDKINTFSFSDHLDLFIKFLESKSYKKSTLINYRRTLKKIDLYMNLQSISGYSEMVGLQYFNYYIHEHKIELSRQAAIRTAIRRFNDFYLGNEYTLQPTTLIELLPNNYEEILSRYVLHCYDLGNKDNTIEGKCRFIRCFLKDCITQGCLDIVSLNPSQVIKACLRVQNKDGWAAIRVFLKFINTEGIHVSDFSTLCATLQTSVSPSCNI
jgi:hypothetical protein